MTGIHPGSGVQEVGAVGGGGLRRVLRFLFDLPDGHDGAAGRCVLDDRACRGSFYRIVARVLVFRVALARLRAEKTRQNDLCRTIGWIVLDAGVVLGVFLHR